MTETTKRKVAAYARVSTDNEEQETSYEAQKDYYENHIKNHEGLEFVKIYTDQGISGTSTKHREGFQEMVDDARGELRITIMSSLAQEEIRSISENVRRGQRKKAADGKYSLYYKHFLGYDKGEDGGLVINKEQAKIVLRIYGMFLEGKSPYSIAKTLTEEGIPPARKKNWSDTTIKRVLSNETYIGDKLLQKTFSIDFLSKDRIKNTGQVPQFYVEQEHDAIIPVVTLNVAWL